MCVILKKIAPLKTSTIFLCTVAMNIRYILQDYELLLLSYFLFFLKVQNNYI